MSFGQEDRDFQSRPSVPSTTRLVARQLFLHCFPLLGLYFFSFSFCRRESDLTAYMWFCCALRPSLFTAGSADDVLFVALVPHLLRDPHVNHNWHIVEGFSRVGARGTRQFANGLSNLGEFNTIMLFCWRITAEIMYSAASCAHRTTPALRRSTFSQVLPLCRPLLSPRPRCAHL